MLTSNLIVCTEQTCGTILTYLALPGSFCQMLIYKMGIKSIGVESFGIIKKLGKSIEPASGLYIHEKGIILFDARLLD